MSWGRRFRSRLMIRYPMQMSNKFKGCEGLIPDLHRYFSCHCGGGVVPNYPQLKRFPIWGVVRNHPHTGTDTHKVSINFPIACCNAFRCALSSATLTLIVARPPASNVNVAARWLPMTITF